MEQSDIQIAGIRVGDQVRLLQDYKGRFGLTKGSEGRVTGFHDDEFMAGMEASVKMDNGVVIIDYVFNLEKV